MQKSDVPQDDAIHGQFREVCYALDEQGAYVLAKTAGWEPANVANLQAWEHIQTQVAAALSRVRSGELSPLAYYMACHMMDARMLASYAGLFAWQVGRHMKPGPFRRMSETTRKRYAAIFRIPIDRLSAVPGDADRT